MRLLFATLLSISIILASNINNSLKIKDFNTTVTVKMPVKRCVVLFPQALPFFYMLHAQKCIVGYPGFGMHKTPYYSGNLILKIDPDFKKRVADIGYAKMVNIEELIKLKPDLAVNVIFAKMTNQKIERFKIPLIKLTLGFGNIKEFIKSVNIIGVSTNHSKNAKKYITYYLHILQYVKSKLINLKNRPKILFLSYEGPKGNKLTSGGKFNTFVNEIIHTAGGYDVSKNVPGFFGEISDENILKWNPDYIILAPGVSPEVLYDNPKLKAVKAVKTKHIYTVPYDGKTRYSNWFAPQESSLGILWLAKILHPYIFKNLNLSRQAQKYYKEFWGLDLKEIALKGSSL